MTTFNRIKKKVARIRMIFIVIETAKCLNIFYSYEFQIMYLCCVEFWSFCQVGLH